MRRLLLVFVLLIASSLAALAAERPIIPCEILEPVTDPKGQVVQQTPDGKAYPVFRLAPQSGFVGRVHKQLEISFAQEALLLNRWARNLLLSEITDPAKRPDRLTSPMYLLLSQEEGGFPRHGFWLQSANGSRKLMPVDFVDLVVDDDTLENGDFEEIFSHELGHLTLETLVGPINDGPSRKMHMVMNVTDYPTAFNEGFAEHFQPIVRDTTMNMVVREAQRGRGANDLNSMWFSKVDQQMRTDGVKSNVFVHEKAGKSEIGDLYALFTQEETSASFDRVRLRTPQQMMASEGVIATIFYRLVNDERIQNKWREPQFYGRFDKFASIDPKATFTPYENAALKIFAALHAIGGVKSGAVPMISLVRSYAKLFPDEAHAVIGSFVRTTWGATVSRETAAALEAAGEFGTRGDLDGYRTRMQSARKLFDTTVADAVSGKLTLDANVGPEIWLLNADFKIARAVWVKERDLPLTINLNTATLSELMSISGLNAGAVLQARSSRGYFKSIDDLRGVAGITDAMLAKLQAMHQKMQSAPGYERQ